MDALVNPWFLLDALLAAMLLWLAWASLSSRDLFRGIVLFIAFGLVLAMAWVRLGAPDVALAEAAIGTGLTGALLLATWGRLRALQEVEGEGGVLGDEGEGLNTVRSAEGGPGILLRAGLLVALGGIAVGLGLALSVGPAASGLTSAVDGALDRSGVTNPVTAVLLNFRSYDTLLEIAVLLAALVGVWALGPAARLRHIAPSPVLEGMNRVLVPVLILVSAYLLWAGTSRPGGAFQAGAVLGAAAVLLILTGGGVRGQVGAGPVRWVATAGLGLFIAVGVAVMLGGRLFLEYPESLAGGLILLIEAAATASIAVVLAALFLGGHPGDTR